MTRIANGRAFGRALLRYVLPLFMIVLLNGPVPAQQIAGAGTSKAQEQPPPQTSDAEAPKATLSQFAWLAGHWQGQWGPRLAQQVWMPAESGTMVGVFQLSENTQTLVVELYTIISTPRGIELRIRHFTPSLTAWEKSPTVLNLKSSDAKSIVFENPDNGQPKNWLMRRTGADTFVARFEIVREKGQQQVAEIVYHRQPAATAPNR
jgi:hypothetical protein